jgi:lipopolysaccharide/colanic/teichoic acid biosynthesis glycosyltransferase
MTSYRGKRGLDLVLVAVTAPLWGSVMIVVGALVWLRLGRPILFGQERVGNAGRPFRMWKFRTMSDARGSGGELLPDAIRLTPFGRRLRGWSLDELPELFNVVLGDMSLVGPRPLLMRYLGRYSPRHQRRHCVPPGITGLAQVMGRNTLSWPEKFEMDVEYVQRCSLRLDLQILSRTVRAVLVREGISPDGEATMPEFMGYESDPGTGPAEASPRPESG